MSEHDHAEAPDVSELGAGVELPRVHELRPPRLGFARGVSLPPRTRYLAPDDARAGLLGSDLEAIASRAFDDGYQRGRDDAADEHDRTLAELEAAERKAEAWIAELERRLVRAERTDFSGGASSEQELESNLERLRSERVR